MYLYETHQHTAPCSRCASADPAALVRTLKAEGFSGVVLTNHFYHGNTGIHRHMAWADFVAAYEEDYLTAKAEGDKLDLDVLFGIEEGIGDGKEVLLYGITPAFLYDHPELGEGQGWGGGSLPQLAAAVHGAGGLLFQAHPFRVRDYIPRPWEETDARYLDGVEVYNYHNTELENARAMQWAQKTGLLLSAGSDAHTADLPGRYGMAFPERIRTEAALAEALRREDYELWLPEH